MAITHFYLNTGYVMLQLRSRIQHQKLEHFFDVFRRTDVTHLLQQVGHGPARHGRAAVQLQTIDHPTIANLKIKKISKF